MSAPYATSHNTPAPVQPATQAAIADAVAEAVAPLVETIEKLRTQLAEAAHPERLSDSAAASAPSTKPPRTN